MNGYSYASITFVKCTSKVGTFIASTTYSKGIYDLNYYAFVKKRGIKITVFYI